MLESSDASVNKQYTLKVQLLVHSNKAKEEREVVLRQLLRSVMLHYHCTPTCLHFGVRKTVGKIAEKF